MTDINVPKLGDGVDGAEILSVLVQVGDTVSEGQSLLELESDKATVEVPSTAAGVVKSLAVSEGDTVSEGQLILSLEAAGESEQAPDAEQASEKPAEASSDHKAAKAPASEASSEPASQASTAASDLEIVIPKLGDGVEGAEVLNIMVSEGDTLEKGDALLELESDKATVEIPSEVAGVLQSLQIAVGDTVSEGQVIGIVKGQGHRALRY